jgi:hypothetical protein
MASTSNVITNNPPPLSDVMENMPTFAGNPKMGKTQEINSHTNLYRKPNLGTSKLSAAGLAMVKGGNAQDLKK